jgi:hypothetical protein
MYILWKYLNSKLLPFCPQNLSFLGPRFERPRTQRHETSIWKLKESQARENFL